MTDICDNWSQIPDGDKSDPDQIAQTDLRIYCDNPVATTERKRLREGCCESTLIISMTEQRLRKLPNGRVVDTNNAMIDTQGSDCSLQEVIVNGHSKWISIYAFVYNKPMYRVAQNKDRSVMTLCDASFTGPYSMKHIDDQRDWQMVKDANGKIFRVSASPFREVTSFLVLHEASQSPEASTRAARQLLTRTVDARPSVPAA